METQEFIPEAIDLEESCNGFARQDDFRTKPIGKNLLRSLVLPKPADADSILLQTIVDYVVIRLVETRSSGTEDELICAIDEFSKALGAMQLKLSLDNEYYSGIVKRINRVRSALGAE